MTECLNTPVLGYLNCKLIFKLPNLESRLEEKLACLTIHYYKNIILLLVDCKWLRNFLGQC